jgi:hypothetical protein
MVGARWGRERVRYTACSVLLREGVRVGDREGVRVGDREGGGQ